MAAIVLGLSGFTFEMTGIILEWSDNTFKLTDVVAIVFEWSDITCELTDIVYG